MSDIKEIIKANRPKLSDGSLRTYSSIIKNLMKAIEVKEFDKATIKQNIDKILTYVKPFSPKKRKTILSAIIVSLDDGKEGNAEIVEKLKTMMLKDIKESDEQDEKQERTEKQAENWMSMDDIMKVYNSLKEEVKPLWKLDKPKKSAFMRLQDFVMLSCLLLIPPRRSLDWVDFRIRDVDKEKDNYMSGNKLIFNSYKTKKYYGRQEVNIDKNPLKKILTDWMKINTTPYLLVDTTMKQPLNQSKLTIRLYGLFDGKKVSVNMLRHIFITERVLPSIPKLNEMKETAREMGHSLDQQLKYKIDEKNVDDTNKDVVSSKTKKGKKAV
jgi:hypothetical protein